MDNNKDYHTLTYSHLLRHSSDTSTKGLALSEFIDNSINSYLAISTNKDEIKNISGCNINIIVDETDPKNLKIIIKDNSGGMEKDGLYEAAREYHNSFDKQTNKINQYGIGMKLAIFWFGQNGKIWTKTKNGIEYMLDYEANKHKPSDPVITPIIESTENKIDGHGTIIQIENVYADNQLNRRLIIDPRCKSKTQEDVYDTLRFRFTEYIANGLIINFSRITKDNPTEEHCKNISPTNIQDTNIFETKSFKLNSVCGIDKIEDATEEEYQDFEDKKEMFKNIRNRPEIKNCKDYEILLRLIENNKPLVIEESIDFMGNKLPVKLCFLSESKGKYCGVGVKHCYRFIYHLPNKSNGGVGSMPFTRKDRFLDGIYRWMYAEVDLTDTNKYKIVPDKNKANLVWSDDARAKWDEEFEKMISRYENFIRLVLQKLTNNSNSTDEIKRIKKLHQTDPSMKNLNFDGKDYVIKTNSEDQINKLYKIGDTQIKLQKKETLDKVFEWNQVNDNSYELSYNDYNGEDIFKPELMEFYFLKLVSLLKLISIGQYKNDNDILEMINDILREHDIE